MIAHTPIVLACRARALTLSVCTTGAVSLASTATGYTRATGSFVTDGFRIGMQVTPSGFSFSTPEVVTGVTALTMTTDTTHAVQAAASRTLSVGLPAQPDAEINRGWENLQFTPTNGVPYIAEEYLPGQMTGVGLGAGSDLEATSLYLLKFYGPFGTGREALAAYADAALLHFAPPLALALSTGDTARVRRDLAPYASQLLREEVHAVVTVTIPLRTRSASPR